MKYYTGIGSRQTPALILLKMEKIGYYMARKGWILRSGGANGADSAFEKGHNNWWYQACGGHTPVMLLPSIKEIFLPWKDFNENKSNLYHISPKAYEIASKIHPAWHNCSRGAMALHARNIHQVLGNDLQIPSELVIFYAKEADGTVFGGTGTAVKLARQHNIPTINMYFTDWQDKFVTWTERNLCGKK